MSTACIKLRCVFSSYNIVTIQKPSLKYIKVYGEHIKVYGEHIKVYGEHIKVYGEHIKVYGEHIKVYGEHIKVYGVRNVIEMILNVVNKFCSDCHYDDSPPVYPLVLASAPAPYLLKGLSIIHYDTVTESCKPVMKFRLDSRECAGNISALTKCIILFQLNSLEHVSITYGNFCYSSRDCDGTKEYYAERNYSIPEHRELLSALADLLKQPQLQSLSVGRALLTEAYQLVEVFLCTETTHSLSLTIEGVEEENKWWKVILVNGYREKMTNRAMINRAMNSLVMINRGHMMKTVIQLLCPQPFVHCALLQLSLFQTAIGL